MNLDRTFCIGKMCGQRERCDRWSYNLERWAANHRVDLSHRRISMSDFSLRQPDCQMYSPIDREEGKRNGQQKATR